ncbi:hypothetical protein F0562_023733 [Nyssa sinensis]|uniref:DUF4283 domain-containing protein n=1 Tax=Nyssa sinensis TaxID=561372 RepID=A0A5J5BN69_9ASTE|nr:hypothetical protein F0562_023733 [Nyssa sinensis]
MTAKGNHSDPESDDGEHRKETGSMMVQEGESRMGAEFRSENANLRQMLKDQEALLQELLEFKKQTLDDGSLPGNLAGEPNLEGMNGGQDGQQERNGVQASIENQDVVDELTRLKNSLLGYVMGEKLSFKKMLGFIRRLWKNMGNVQLHSIREGHFLFEFAQAEDKMKAMEEGPWSVESKPPILKLWSSSTDVDKKELDSSG